MIEQPISAQKTGKKTKLARITSKGRQIDPKALAEVRQLLGDASRQKDLLIEHLHKIQDFYKHISAAHLVALAYEMKLSRAEVYEVATFYHHFDVIKEGDTIPADLTVRVCDSMSCEMAGAEGLIDSLETAMGQKVRVQRVPCIGRCDKAPVAVVGMHPVEFADVQKVDELVEQNVTEPETIAPILFEQYVENGGYSIYQQCMAGQHKVENVLDMMDDSGLRGLGGAGFPVGRKWRIVRDQPAPRLMAVNIDEGEPGTFKDKYYLDRDPHCFLEGMLIAAWAVDINEIYIYLRDEYAAIRVMLEQEIAKLRAHPPVTNLPTIHLRRGAGAYICGEESAMIESIEGKRGMPRLRPPFVAQVGLFGRPTLEHNMESLYWVRDILEKGPQCFTDHGRHGRKGLRSFSVSGRVNKPGVHLAPAGITMRELIDEYCGGMLEGHEFYGYFPGGASGGILPASLGDVPLDFDTLHEYDCFIGSAAVIVFSDKDRARDLAVNAMRFFEDESCGQCTPCRVGTAKAVTLMKQAKWDEPLLEELSQVMVDASICGLGQAAPNPLRCVVKYFPEELK
ncbi:MULTISPECIES: NAD(P)H-dependent oxidoreductase subunit E [unclassified Methylophaga]|jgi:formate dehydrogenase|uniref:NAD(P)H-dependent oxidoreductase subunit E n=1 Tax=unclassified Methylophaga TaxID=2629249 RepID=UPI000C91FCC1|nr:MULTISPECIES: NAD(P)H-dependent oxidoreductase subunit E [unclassified Methylophaga]MAK67852.1 NADH-quinone oxidoreductase subunit F [Methylophaga sp.]MAY18533.1 NADH-quinone oxidoreductase subunit F [Methylophaga sp.]MBN45841.1 NADH-quinone oxidoreductase subunit F [Methylophaga sp.]|tara:strand:+ start:40259 stop:41956 length:1698 start_codon:yes stop_codon:yes gene_type:complete